MNDPAVFLTAHALRLGLIQSDDPVAVQIAINYAANDLLWRASQARMQYNLFAGVVDESGEQFFEDARKDLLKVIHSLLPWAVSDPASYQSMIDKWKQRFGELTDPQVKKAIDSQIRFLKRVKEGKVGRKRRKAGTVFGHGN